MAKAPLVGMVPGACLRAGSSGIRCGELRRCLSKDSSWSRALRAVSSPLGGIDGSRSIDTDQWRPPCAISSTADAAQPTGGTAPVLSLARKFERRREALRLAQRSKAVNQAAPAAQAVASVRTMLGSQAAAPWRVRLAMKKQQIHECLKAAHASAMVTSDQSPKHLAPAQAGIFAAGAGGSGQQSATRQPITPLPISTTKLKALTNHAPVLQCPSGFTPFAAVKYRLVGAASVDASTSGAAAAIRSCAASTSGLDGMTAVTSVGPAQAAHTCTLEAPACLREPQNNMTNPVACSGGPPPSDEACFAQLTGS